MCTRCSQVLGVVEELRAHFNSNDASAYKLPALKANRDDEQHARDAINRAIALKYETLFCKVVKEKTPEQRPAKIAKYMGAMAEETQKPVAALLHEDVMGMIKPYAAPSNEPSIAGLNHPSPNTLI